MLSRIADALYWMSRYIERADNTARLLEINLLHMIEAEDVLTEPAMWRPILRIGDHEPSYMARYPDGLITGARVLAHLTDEPTNDNGIRGSIRHARENARMVRDRLSREMWECLNEIYLALEDSPRRAPRGRGNVGRSAEFYNRLREEIARFHGTTISTMMRGEPFSYYLLGTFVERADMTARVLDVKYHIILPNINMVGSPVDYYQWGALLKSLSGFEAYRRQYHSGLRPVDVVAFAVFETHFPRSLRFCVNQLRWAIQVLDERPMESDLLTGPLQALLEGTSAAEIFEGGLHEFLQSFLDQVNVLHDELAARYFEARLPETDQSNGEQTEVQ